MLNSFSLGLKNCSLNRSSPQKMNLTQCILLVGEVIMNYIDDKPFPSKLIFAITVVRKKIREGRR